MALRIGIIGTGGIAENAIAPAIAKVPGAELWSVLSRSKARAREFATTFGARAGEPAFDDIGAFLADERLDAVFIASPDRLHAEQTILAAQAKKHVLVEKPMATSPGEAKAMVDACRAAGVRLGVAFHLRWHAGHRLLVAQVREGAIGELRHVRVQWTYRARDASNWRASSDVGRWWALAGTGPHCVDLARWILVPSCGEIVEQRSLISSAIYLSGSCSASLFSMSSRASASFESERRSRARQASTDSSSARTSAPSRRLF